MHKLLLGCLLLMSGLQVRALTKSVAKGVQVIADEPHRCVKITMDGELFTAYIWPTTLKKPVLFPLMAPGEVEVTRGFPLTPHSGERTDHPHHAGMWFNYGNVNGYDFWNNSDAIQPEARSKMGTIEHQRIVSTKNGLEQGELEVESVWITGDNKEILKETTRYIFTQRKDARVIDRITTLRALDHVVFHDDKEGVLGIRVARWLESPNEKGGTFTDANGVETKVEAQNAPGATGVYLTSEGVKGDAAWGTRGRWCTLTGNTGDTVVTIAVLDHSNNPDYPTYWHARGYGLFAANPLGRKIFDPSASPFNFTLDKAQTAVFRHRVILFSHAVASEEMNHEAEVFETDYR
jgi:Methane oxygenase PmoA